VLLTMKGVVQRSSDTVVVIVSSIGPSHSHNEVKSCADMPFSA
jgi:hypothetical protein